jgi:hypothetical protein
VIVLPLLAVGEEAKEEVGELPEEEGEEVGAAEEGALDEGGEDEVVGDPEEVGAAALKVVVDNKDSGPELNRIAEREAIARRDRTSVRLLIVILVSSVNC